MFFFLFLACVQTFPPLKCLRKEMATLFTLTYLLALHCLMD